MNEYGVLILTAIVLLAMIMNLVTKPAFSARLTTICMAVGLMGGLIFYSFGFAESSAGIGVSMFRAVLAVIRMFVGVNDLSAISGAAVVSTPVRLSLFWGIHLLAFYSMASAAMFTLGEELLRHLRLLLSRSGELVLIYGIHERSIALGREYCEDRKHSVVLLAEDLSSAQITDLNNQGMSVLTGSQVTDPDAKLVRKLGMRGRKVTVYALDDETDRDLVFAMALKDAMEKEHVPAAQTSITLPGAEDILMPMLQVSPDRYGYGYVNVVENSMLAARALIRTCPPWEQIRFGADGRAAEDFSCVVIGFGSHGQAVLKQLVMNGQFVGSHFHAAVFAPHYQNEMGFLSAECPALLENYDITFYPEDSRSNVFYDFLKINLDSLKMIAVCTGSSALNREISDSLMLFLKRHQAENICVVSCNGTTVLHQKQIGSPILRTEIYTRAFLSAERADRDAMLINAAYDTSERSVWDKWVACDSFSKMSSRAAADFLPAFARAAGEKGKVLFSDDSGDSGNSGNSVDCDGCGRFENEGGATKPAGSDMSGGAAMADPNATADTLTEAGSSEKEKIALLNTLGEMEHLRWIAFHTCMGYVPMSFDQVRENAARALAGEIPLSAVTKDRQLRIHACLIPWDQLDDLGALEKELTGRAVNYKQLDINNVLALPQILGNG